MKWIFKLYITNLLILINKNMKAYVKEKQVHNYSDKIKLRHV